MVGDRFEYGRSGRLRAESPSRYTGILQVDGYDANKR